MWLHESLASQNFTVDARRFHLFSTFDFTRVQVRRASTVARTLFSTSIISFFDSAVFLLFERGDMIRGTAQTMQSLISRFHRACKPQPHKFKVARVSLIIFSREKLMRRGSKTFEFRLRNFHFP